MSPKDPLLSVSLFCHLASIILCTLILFETLAFYKSFTYLLTYLQPVSDDDETVVIENAKLTPTLILMLTLTLSYSIRNHNGLSKWRQALFQLVKAVRLT